MPVHDQPDPSLIINGKRVPKPRTLEPSSPEPQSNSKSSGVVNSKKNIHARSISTEEDTVASQPLSKKQKQKEKQSKILQFTNTIESSTPTVESASNASQPPTSEPETGTETAPTTRKTAARHQHRLQFPGRPEINCVADHPYLRSSDSLAWTFLTLEKPVHNDTEDKLLQARMTCAFCIADDINPPQFWDWFREKWDGSTGNFLKHFKKSHGDKWAAIHHDDQAIINPGAAKQVETQGNLNSWSKVRICHWA